MKHRLKMNALLGLPAIIAALTAYSGVPLPSVTYVGCVRDAYGYPYAKDAEVVLFKGSVECVRYRVSGEMTPGINYRLELEMDSGGTPYEPYAAHAGDLLDLKVYYQGQAVPVMTNALLSSTGVLKVPAAGSMVRLNIQTGADSDGDGLPDAWEELLIAQSEGALNTLDDVRPGDDFDGDGSSNLHEFQSGTFPFLSYDCFALEHLQRDTAGRLSFRFLAVAGFTYQVCGAPSLTASVWSDQPFATAPTASLDTGYIYGDDTFKTLYVETTNTIGFIRLRIK